MLGLLSITFASASESLDQKADAAGEAVQKSAEVEMATAMETVAVAAESADRSQGAVARVLKKLQPIGVAAAESALEEVPPILEARDGLEVARHKLVQTLMTSSANVVEKTAAAIEKQIPGDPVP